MQQQTSAAKQADSTATAVKKTAPPVGEGVPRSPSTHAMNGHDHVPHAANDRVHSESDEEEDRDEILEESPCGRYGKRREQVKQRDVPGIDRAYLSMDIDSGNEVVWNEVQFSERKNFRAQEDKIRAIFDNLTHLQHTNLVKFHKYWIDLQSEKPRVIFITEYMSSGSMAQFLRRTRKGSKSMTSKVWKKWCTQILSALCYLHAADPPIVHGNLNCNTIFIQINGLIKIGCVAPNTIHHHVKTFREHVKNLHYFAPEYEMSAVVTPAADIYAFGVCALEMAALGFGLVGMNGAEESAAMVATSASTTSADAGDKPVVAPAAAQAPLFVSPETITRTLESLEDPLMRDFIGSCLRASPTERPTARQLLFHSILFEVHSLKLLSAYVLAGSRHHDVAMSIGGNSNGNAVLAYTRHTQFHRTDLQPFEVDKYLEDVRNGIYPLTAFAQRVDCASTSSTIAHKIDKHAESVRAVAVADTLTKSANSANALPNKYDATSLAGAAVNSSVVHGHASTSTASAAAHRTSTSISTNDGGDRQQSAKDESTKAELKKVSSDRLSDMTDHEYENETRRVKAGGMTAEVRWGECCTLTLVLRLEDGMVRQVSAEVKPPPADDTAPALAHELVTLGLLADVDAADVQRVINDALRPPDRVDAQ